jgi:hypothetical protein
MITLTEHILFWWLTVILPNGLHKIDHINRLITSAVIFKISFKSLISFQISSAHTFQCYLKKIWLPMTAILNLLLLAYPYVNDKLCKNCTPINFQDYKTYFRYFKRLYTICQRYLLRLEILT